MIATIAPLDVTIVGAMYAWGDSAQVPDWPLVTQWPTPPATEQSSNQGQYID